MAREHYADLIREVQDRLITRYLHNQAVGSDQAEAMEIQRFLQALKAMRLSKLKSTPASYKGVASAEGGAAALQAIIDAYGDTMILNTVYEEIEKVTHKRSIFLARGNRYERGNELEQDLRDVLVATVRAAVEASAKDKAKLTSGLRGKNTVQIGGLNAQTANEGATQAIVELGDMTAKQAINLLANVLGASKPKKDEYSDRYGKVDVTGEKILEYVVNFNIKPEFARLIDLLSKATFTAKNYASRSIQDLKLVQANNSWKTAKWEENNYTELHLGDTNIDKTLRSVLGDLGYSGAIVDRIIYGAATIIEKNEDSGTIGIIQTTFQQMRFIYELSGAGQSFKGFSNGTARFLVYNDPTGDPLYVVPTSQLIQEALAGLNELGRQHGKITISKSLVAKAGSYS